LPRRGKEKKDNPGKKDVGLISFGKGGGKNEVEKKRAALSL